jgi:hypothetical protein
MAIKISSAGIVLNFSNIYNDIGILKRFFLQCQRKQSAGRNQVPLKKTFIFISGGYIEKVNYLQNF